MKNNITHAQWDQLTADPICVAKLDLTLGEGPVWVASENAFFFTDIKGCKIFRLSMETKEITSWVPPEAVAFLVPADDKTLILGHMRSLGCFDLETHKFSHLKDLEDGPDTNRFNDACICTDGHIWCGTMDDSEKDPTGVIYRVEKSEKPGEKVEIHRRDEGFTISNGPTVSPDGKAVYICDSPDQVIYVYNRIDGILQNKRVFVRLESGYPDGIVVDADGNVWSAVWAGNRIDCYSPEGKKLLTKKFPTSNVTKMAFGGPDRKDVLVTTATKDLSSEQKKDQPCAGGIFMFRSDIAGKKEELFRIK